MKANKSRDLVEANLVVYSVTDRASFQYAQSCLQELRPAKRHNVVILVANKQDIVRNRVISEQGEYNTHSSKTFLLFGPLARWRHRAVNSGPTVPSEYRL